ncbi:hypothetical protein J2W27_002705 [Variovorax boronicumulans]|nr:hypothetical protein [Variovorax boronicumulans]
MDATGIGTIIFLCMTYSVLVMGAVVWLVDMEATGWYILLNMIAMASLFVLWLAGLVGVVGVWTWIEKNWLPSAKGRPEPFNAKAKLDIGEDGLSVQGLGHVDWIDVLAIEGIPDSDTNLIVHTRPFHKLMLTAAVDELAPVINHYLELRSSCKTALAGTLQTRAIVFCWPCFLAWIWAGYALAGTMGLAILLHASNASLFKTMVALCVLLPLVAWLVWAIPFSRISLFSHSRVRAFEFDNTRLRSMDGAWHIDLQRARVSHRQVSGIGYEFDFLSIRSKVGQNLDLLLDGSSDQRELLSVLRQRGLLQQSTR